MSSPARSSASATSAGGLGGGGSCNAGFVDDISSYHSPTDLISVHDRKDEALAAWKSELAGSLQKEVKSLDEDSRKFARPRS
ncbi:putative protein SAMBA [Cocos nucifera]|nr:putative protein SAMBA [Cocos nucifera]